MRLRIVEQIDAYNRDRRGPDDPLMTQRLLAKEAGTTEPQLSAYANNKTEPRPSLLLRMAQVLRCTIDDLVEAEDPEGGETGRPAPEIES